MEVTPKTHCHRVWPSMDRTMKLRTVVLLVGLFAIGPSKRAFARDDSPCSRLNRSNLVPCALSASLLVKSESEELEAARARQVAARPILPSNPELAVSAARRTSGSSDADNWYVTLQQEIEIAGQRGARGDAAAASLTAQSQRVVVSRRHTAARAWLGFFEVLAAAEERGLAARLAELTERVSAVARARAEQGLSAPIEADVAAATAVAALTAKLGAERRLKQNEFALAAMLGLDPVSSSITVAGELRPLEGVSEALTKHSAASVAARPEVVAANAEARAQEHRAEAFRRSRIPNPTLSVFAQNDGFNERVFGAGIALPIPLPGNVGRTHIGEIAEAEALARKARTEGAQFERDLRLDIANAAQGFESTTTAVEVFSKEQLDRAAESLDSLAGEVEAGRLAIRDAILSQQVLIDFLRAHVEARRAWCIASVELARSLGVALEGGSH
jgi:outer membrane protein, heavy metal efflux system